jgi:hypothetical protein
MRILTFTPAVILLLVAGLDAQPPKKLDPCALLSKADIQEAVGQNVTDPKPNPHNPTVCDIKAGDFGSIGIMAHQPRPGETAEKTMLELQKRKIPVTEAKGIGDRSFFASPGYGMTQLNMFKGPHYIIITLLVPGAGEEKQKAIAEKLMRKALPKI